MSPLEVGPTPLALTAAANIRIKDTRAKKKTVRSLRHDRTGSTTMLPWSRRRSRLSGSLETLEDAHSLTHPRADPEAHQNRPQIPDHPGIFTGFRPNTGHRRFFAEERRMFRAFRRKIASAGEIYRHPRVLSHVGLRAIPVPFVVELRIGVNPEFERRPQHSIVRNGYRSTPLRHLLRGKCKSLAGMPLWI